MSDVRRTLAGRYELGEVLGRGGMGAVYRARDLVLGRAVAVKVLPGLVSDQDPIRVARFEREARAAAALSHPAVVAVYDAGADDTSRFIVMELISGRSLQAILRDEGRLDPERAVGIAARVADALAAAHAAGIVHRDIKPANVMVAADGSVKVLDFGIARAMDGTALTQTSSVLGTAAYMSPEQAVGKPADARSDIYALGCVLYALVAGRPPFTGDGAAAVLHQHVNGAPPSLRAANRRVSPALDALVMAMLAKAPDERPQSAGEVRDRLTDRPAVPSGRPAGTAPTARLGQTTATRPLPRARSRRRRRLLLAGALAAGVLVIALITLASGGSSPHPATNARHDPKHASAASAAARQAATTTATSSSTPASRSATTASNTPTTTATSTEQPQTVSGAAGALTALVTQDVQAGTITQDAPQQISNALSDVLNSYATGHTTDIQHKLADLAQHVTDLEQQGKITSAAAPALNQAIATLTTTLSHATPPTTTAGPPAQPGAGGPSPDKAKHPKPPGH